MKKRATPLVDEHLQAFNGMQEAGTNDFFYTRLKARMLTRGADKTLQGWSLPLKPVWVLGTLTLLLTVNGYMLSRQAKTKPGMSTATAYSLQNFAESYDQAISSSY